MTILASLFLILISSCSHQKPDEAKFFSVAYDSMAEDKVKATAIKRSLNDAVCFEISIWMKDSKAQNALPANWTVAWVDHQKNHHLLSLNQRDPASIVKGSAKEWKNDFVACTPNTRLTHVKALVLTPKEFPDVHDRELQLNWFR